MTGGGTGAGTSPGTATTEVYQPGAGRWRLVGPLPAAVRGVAGAALANTVYMMGRLVLWSHSVLFRASNEGQEKALEGSTLYIIGGVDSRYHRTIWRYDDAEEAWHEAGTMGERRAWHRVTVVTREEILQYCH